MTSGESESLNHDLPPLDPAARTELANEPEIGG